MATRKCPQCKGKSHFIGIYGLPFPNKDCPTCRGTGKQHQEWVAGE